MDPLRKPAVAGQFYPGTAKEIKGQISSFLPDGAVKKRAIACVLPHAGYAYSGRVAAETVSRINIPRKVILLGPNHTGCGAPFSLMSEGSWETPLGRVNIDAQLSRAVLKNSSRLKSDSLAHADEHSLEVELPILQYFRPDFEIVPIAFLSDEVAVLKDIGREIAGVIKEQGLADSVLVVASSDMTHYEPKDAACKKDGAAIQAILDLDEDKLWQRVRSLEISMCGAAPVTAMLSLAKGLGAKSAQLVKYQTSGDATGDTAAVVGYAGIIIY
jgi:AmmeMemoRadiSam system protein B